MPKVTIGSTMRTTAARYSERRTHRQLICSDNFGGRGAAPPFRRADGCRRAASAVPSAVCASGAAGGCRVAAFTASMGSRGTGADVVADRRYDGGQSIVGRRAEWAGCARAPLRRGIGGGTLACCGADRSTRHRPRILGPQWPAGRGALRYSLAVRVGVRRLGCPRSAGALRRAWAHRAHMT